VQFFSAMVLQICENYLLIHTFFLDFTCQLNHKLQPLDFNQEKSKDLFFYSFMSEVEIFVFITIRPTENLQL
jgi:hypothetical protein